MQIVSGKPTLFWVIKPPIIIAFIHIERKLYPCAFSESKIWCSSYSRHFFMSLYKSLVVFVWNHFYKLLGWSHSTGLEPAPSICAHSMSSQAAEFSSDLHFWWLRTLKPFKLQRHKLLLWKLERSKPLYQLSPHKTSSNFWLVLFSLSILLMW